MDALWEENKEGVYFLPVNEIQPGHMMTRRARCEDAYGVVIGVTDDPVPVGTLANPARDWTGSVRVFPVFSLNVGTPLQARVIAQQLLRLAKEMEAEE